MEPGGLLTDIMNSLSGFFRLEYNNFSWWLTGMKYILNNPQMHIWHHEKNLPFNYGVNFGLTLSIWDYLFQTAYIQGDGRDNEPGFPGEEHFPGKFPGQFIYPVSFRKKFDK